MGFEALERLLRRAFGASSSPPPGFRERLGHELLARHVALYGGAGQRDVALRSRWRAGPVLALGLIGLLATAAVGAIPVSYRLRIGRVVTLELPASAGRELGVAELLDTAAPAGSGSVSVSLARSAGGGQRLMLLVLDSPASADAAVARVRRRYPELRAVRSQELVGDIRIALAEYLRRRVFAVDVSGADRLAAQRAIGRALAERGYPEAVVEVEGAGGRRTVHVRLGAERPAP